MRLGINHKKNILFGIYAIIRRRGVRQSLNYVINLLKSQGFRKTLNRVYLKIVQLHNFVPKTNVQIEEKLNSESVNVYLREYYFRQIHDLEIKFSIVVPLYGTKRSDFDELVFSVKNQFYANWELILVDDGVDRHIRSLAEKLAQSDKRIIFQYNSLKKGISGATNTAATHASGQMIVFLDHDDVLTLDCLAELYVHIKKSNANFLYSDEIKIGKDFKLEDPHYKPSWSPHSILNTMYTGHVSCVTKEMFMKVGGLRSEYDGCQDWDFVLRISELPEFKPHHIPKILYYWRKSPSSIADSMANKGNVVNKTILMREEALTRRGIDGTVTPLLNWYGYNFIGYHPPKDVLISVIIPTRNNLQFLRKCVDSIFQHLSEFAYEIIVVDNGSTDNSLMSYLKEGRFKTIRIDATFNFSELCNRGAEIANGTHLLFFNDDAEMTSDSRVEQMLGLSSQPKVGAVGAKLLYPRTLQIQHAGIVNMTHGPCHAFQYASNTDPGYYLRLQLDYNVVAVTAACLMIETSKFRLSGGFDTELPVAYNDIELCFRLLRLGYFNVVSAQSIFLHSESITRGADIGDIKSARLQSDKSKLFQKHPGFFSNDPFSNRNFDLLDPNFTASGGF